jgi:hypothetical protein
MKRLGDSGRPYDAVLAACMSPEERALRREGTYFSKRSGLLTSRPADAM